MIAGVLLTSIFTVLAGLCSFKATGRGGLIVFWLFFAPYALCGYSSTSASPAGRPFSGYVGGAAPLAFFLVLCTVPGRRGDHRYGPNPLI